MARTTQTARSQISKASNPEKKPAKKTKVRSGDLKFDLYIFKVLKQVHPDTGITTVAKDQLNAVVNYIGEALASRAVELSTKSGRATVTTRDVQSAVRMEYPGELSKHAVSEGTKAVTKYNANAEEKGSASAKAGLQFPIARTRKFFDPYKKRVGNAAPVYLAAVLEYLVAEIVELSGNAARDGKKVRIVVRHLYMAIEGDEELNRMFRDMHIELSGTGVMPHIDSTLLPEKGSSKKKTSRKAKSGEKLPHKFRPGTVALRDIRKQQKMSQCIYFGRQPFQRLIREIGQDFADDVNYSQDAMMALQLYVEHYIVGLMEDANKIAIHSERQTLMPKDIQLTRSIRGERL